MAELGVTLIGAGTVAEVAGMPQIGQLGDRRPNHQVVADAGPFKVAGGRSHSLAAKALFMVRPPAARPSRDTARARPGSGLAFTSMSRSTGAFNLFDTESGLSLRVD
ncbi:hypothetical protein [Roseicyclus sp.]|uniref:hypothetical protein n=1 Tax=Roseicyclus sp. TaxID=1914329 RepID=UPI003F6BB82D